MRGLPSVYRVYRQVEKKLRKGETRMGGDESREMRVVCCECEVACQGKSHFANCRPIRATHKPGESRAFHASTNLRTPG